MQPVISKKEASQSGSFWVSSRGVEQAKSSPKFDENKKTLVLDLDETLVYLTLETPSKGLDYAEICYEGKFQGYAIKRPGLDGFIKEMSKLFNVCTYTSMKRKYVTNVVEAVGLSPYIFEVYAREQCVKISEKTYLKSLLNLGFDLSSTIFMDDSPHQMRCQPLNGILVQSFKGEADDNALSVLAPFLRYSVELSDVRPVTDKLYAYFEAETEEQEKRLKPQKPKKSPKNIPNRSDPLSLIMETTEEEDVPKPKLEVRRWEMSPETNTSAKSMPANGTYNFDSNSTSNSGSQSRGSFTICSDQETDDFLSQLEVVKTSSLKANKQIKVE